MSPAVIIAVTAGVSLGVTVVVLLIRGSHLLGKLVNRVENQDAKIDNLGIRIDNLEAKVDARFESIEAKIDALEAKSDARFDALLTAINELRDDVQQTNKILVGLANHTHDADGRTVFTIPQ